MLELGAEGFICQELVKKQMHPSLAGLFPILRTGKTFASMAPIINIYHPRLSPPGARRISPESPEHAVAHFHFSAHESIASHAAQRCTQYMAHSLPGKLSAGRPHCMPYSQTP